MNKCNRCEREAHHTHHIDHNHKNNKPENLERLCTLCHAKEHDIEPHISELRRLVIFYERAQKAKVTVSLVVKSFDRIEIDAPSELKDEVVNLRKLEDKYERNISKYWKEMGAGTILLLSTETKAFMSSPMSLYNWLVSIRGISDVLASKLISRIDFTRTPSVASLWAYAGYTPTSKKTKGKKASWNQVLKRDCYQLADSFIKQRTPRYRQVYDVEKQKQLDNGLPKGHSHNRAIRKIIKLFLRDYYLFANKNV